jgi:hypothetical protein
VEAVERVQVELHRVQENLETYQIPVVPRKNLVLIQDLVLLDRLVIIPDPQEAILLEQVQDPAHREVLLLVLDQAALEALVQDHRALGQAALEVLVQDHQVLGQAAQEALALDHRALGQAVQEVLALDHRALGQVVQEVLVQDLRALGQAALEVQVLDHRALGQVVQEALVQDHQALDLQVQGPAHREALLQVHDQAVLEALVPLDHVQAHQDLQEVGDRFIN